MSRSAALRFEWTLTLGALLTIASNLLGVLIGVVVLYYKNREWTYRLHIENKLALGEIRATLAEMEPKISAMWEWFINRNE